MLSAEALRLAAIETLCPTQALLNDDGYPTLAGRNVLDSREVTLQDLDPEREYTPVLALYTARSKVELAGNASAAWDTTAEATLEIVAELAVADGDGADATADTDPQARLVLGALCSQVRFLLERSPQGSVWRQIVRHIISIEEETFAAPSLGVRWQRITMVVRCSIRDDKFQDGNLPEPCASVLAALPDQSYARGKLLALAEHFPTQIVTPLEGVDMRTGSIVPGATVNFPSS
jgi:hypothetical protein